MKRILIVEDDRTLRDGLCRSLISDAFLTESAGTLAETDIKCKENEYDLILLDCNLPDGNGVDFCTEFRKRSSTPVIFLTVLDSELDEVAAFKAGGIDYIKKSFSLMVLCERINVALTRENGGQTFTDGRYRFDFSAIKFTCDGADITLSSTEVKLLRVLTANRRQIVPRDKLVELLWSCDGEYIDDNALSVTVKRLRTKLGADCIKTVYGLGYMWIGEGK